MRFATIFILGIAVLSTSASLVVRVTVPPCYDSCVSQADTRGCASATDTKCLCNDQTYVSETVKCLEQLCQGDNLGIAISIGESVCLAAGVTQALTASTATPTSGSTPATTSKAKAAAIRHANLNSFVCLAAVGLVALASIY